MFHGARDAATPRFFQRFAGSHVDRMASFAHLFGQSYPPSDLAETVPGGVFICWYYS
jgi:hypothetical protein